MGGKARAKYKQQYLCKAKSSGKKHARQVALNNIPKIQCEGNNIEKNSRDSKKSPPHKGPSSPSLLLQPEVSRKDIFSFADLSVLKKCKARRCTIRVCFSCLIAVFIYNVFVVLHSVSKIQRITKVA